jgi:hypothetical protein
MSDIVNNIFTAPLATLFIVAGILFLLIAVVGNISGKIEPGEKGRLAAGILGLMFVVVGLTMQLLPWPPPMIPDKSIKITPDPLMHSIKDENTKKTLVTFQIQECKRRFTGAETGLLQQYLTCEIIIKCLEDRDFWLYATLQKHNTDSYWPGACSRSRAVDSDGFEYYAAAATIAEKGTHLSFNSVNKKLVSDVPVKGTIGFYVEKPKDQKAQKISLLEICFSFFDEGVDSKKMQFRDIPITDERQ